MIELLFVVCLNASASQCEERSMLYTDVSASACLMRAQPELAKWTETHPGWSISRWRCQQVRPDQKDA